MKTSLFGNNAERVMVLLVAGMASGLIAAQGLTIASNSLVEMREAHEPFLHFTMAHALSVECVLPKNATAAFRPTCSLQIG